MSAAADRFGRASVQPFARREIALVDVLDRLLAGGVVITGAITLRIADVDLVRIDLKALISAVNAQVPSPWPTAADGDRGAGDRRTDPEAP
ncbi:gas vesicle protein [Streptomyces flavofungini]|uniref:gas vesicle protein n=1 Tax=Streptomyces flavofungini TaxID=68200 RepID=UPI0025B133FE|nr:gas vesicle protein [Streptomyces flavofungini]WJV45272.1 gas vesicle protein [Streptomyces flavofungini]